jgi:putative transposase
MPARNIVKTYVAGGFYHIYNRGIEKRIIFEDEMDYKTFLKYLKEALSVPSNGLNTQNTKKMINLQGATLQQFVRPVINFLNSIDLVAYCLMPNHFHLLVKQEGEHDIKRFMQSVITRYSMYFNRKYDRVGKLFQGHYKAVLITDDNYLLHLSRYIHTNPSECFANLTDAYSSYAEYLGIRKTSWIKPKAVLSYFGTVSKDFKQGINTYKGFVEGSKVNSESILGEITLEN